MKHYLPPFSLPPHWRWIFWPIMGVSSSGAAIAIWLEQETIALAECAPLALIPGMAAVLYWFNNLVFKAAQIRREDLKDKTISQDKK